MCGISGVYGYQASFKATLISMGQLMRGEEGCGVAYVCNGKLRALKEPTSPIAFFSHNYSRLINGSMIAIGHNRMPSKGAVSYSNTHPFLSCHEEFALVHNGHSFNDGLAKVLKAEGHQIKGETDSEVLCHHLENLYLEKGNMVDAINGLYDNKFSGAILVLMRDGSMYGVTSSFSPLHVAQCGREIYIASTEDAISSLKGRKVKAKKLDSWEIVEVRRGKLKIHKAIHKEEFKVSKKNGKYTVYRWFPNYLSDMF
jgi:glucosamine--fructose-6-phosphate aminotransferase (isomerizing)